MSASVSDSATASLPEIRSSLSSSLAAGAAGVTTAIAGLRLIARLGRRGPSPATSCGSHYLDRLVLRVLARDAGGDLDTAAVEVARDLLLVLAAEPEAVGAHGGLLVADLVRHPGLVPVLVVPPHLPLARVVVEHRFVDHRDALFHRADRLAHAAAAARLHVGVVSAIGHDVEAGVGALDPAERALHARVEVDDGSHRPRGELLEVRVALGHIPLAVLLRLPDRDRRDGHAFPHLPPLGHLERVRDLGVALGQLDLARLESLVRLLRRLDLEVGTPLHLPDGLADRVEGQEGRRDLREGAQDPDLGVVLFVDPEPGERRLGPEERQLVRRVLLVDVFQQAVEALERRHQERTVRHREAVDRLQPVPRPRLDAFRQRVVHGDRDVDVLGVVARHVLLELFLGVGDDREVLRGDAVSLRTVAVPAERDAPSARLARRQHDPARDARGQVLLEDTAIDNLADQGSHSLLLKPTKLTLLRRGALVVVSWSDQRDYGHTPALSRGTLQVLASLSGHPPSACWNFRKSAARAYRT